MEPPWNIGPKNAFFFDQEVWEKKEWISNVIHGVGHGNMISIVSITFSETADLKLVQL